MSDFEKEKRDVLIYWVCKAGCFTNERFGTLFGLTHFSVSYSFQEMKKKLQSDKEQRTVFALLNSQFKL